MNVKRGACVSASERIYARQRAADAIEEVARRMLDGFADELDRKLVLDAVERRLARLREQFGAA